MAFDTVEEIRKPITEVAKSDKPLIDRFELDYGLFRGNKYIPPEGLRTYTDNTPQTTADKVIDILSKSKLSWNVPIYHEPLKERRDISDTERFFGGCLDLGDQRLLRRGEAPLLQQLAFYAVVRGWVCLRSLIYKSTQKGNPTVVLLDPWDRRWVRYDMGSEGLIWAANQKYLTPEQVKYQYGIELEGGSGVSFEDGAILASGGADAKTYISVVDFFDQKNNSIIVGDQFYKEPTPHNCKHIPVIIRPVGATPLLASNLWFDTIQDVGESWIANNRGFIEHVNLIMSAMLTMVVKGARGTYIVESDTGSFTLESSPGDVDTETISLSKKRQQEIKALETVKMPADTPALMSQMFSKMQEGGIAPPVLGQLGYPSSGIALNMLAESMGTIVDRRALAIADVLEEAAWHLTTQYSDSAYKPIELMVKHDEKTYDMVKYSPSKIKPYRFKVELEPQWTRDEMQKWLIADIQRRPNKDGIPLLSDDQILEYMKWPDTDLIMDKKIEQLVLSDPKFMLLRAEAAFVAGGEKELAQMVAMRRQEMETAKQQPTQQQPTPGAVDTGGLPPNAMPPEQAQQMVMSMLQDPQLGPMLQQYMAMQSQGQLQ